jgi:hypothetical protein
MQQLRCHAEFAGISPGHLADLERMLQRTVDSQPPLHDGAATGWLQGVPYRLLAGRPAAGGFGLLAPREHLVARDAMWATKLVEGLCLPVLHVPCHPLPPPPPICLPDAEELPGAYGPWLISHTSHIRNKRHSIPSLGLGWDGTGCASKCTPSSPSAASPAVCRILRP